MLILYTALCLLVCAAGCGRFVFAAAPRTDRWMAAAVLVPAACYLALRALVLASLLTRTSVLATATAMACCGVAGLRRYRTVPPSSLKFTPDATWCVVITTLGAVSIALAAAYALPVWQWDSLGYHLPVANWVLQEQALARLPQDLPYIGTYPHNVELLYAGLRSLLDSDRLIDLGQMPFGLLGALAVACLARRQNTRAADALAAGCAWLLLPTVFLQLPTNYVDVATAAYFLLASYWVTAPPSKRSVVLSGIALGLLVAAKPSAPPAAIVLFGILLYHLARARHLAWAAWAVAGVLVLGAESYVVNIWRHGNPVWPVVIDLGPWHLPGRGAISELLSSGSTKPHLVGPLAYRWPVSWLTVFAPMPTFDMRVGGFGPLFVLGVVPALLVALWQKRSRVLWPLAVAAVTTSDPAVSRYVLAFPGIALATVAGMLSTCTPRVRRAVCISAALFGAAGVVHALPGLVDAKLPLSALLAAPEDNDFTLGADGPTEAWETARQRLGPAEAAAFDSSFELSYLLWRKDLSNRVVWLAPTLSAAEVLREITGHRISLLVAGEHTVVGAVARDDPARFRPLFECETEACTVYEVTPLDP